MWQKFYLFTKMYRNLLVFIIYCLIHGSYSTPAKEKIVGGQSTTIQKYPYELSLEINGKSNCSASIISANWALTTAFCLDGGKIRPDIITFRAGSSDKNTGGTIHHASKIIIHPSYNATMLNYDFALVQVKEPFAIGTPGVNRVLLAWDEPIDRALATVSGWGIINNQSKQQTNDLHDVQVPILNRAICKGVYVGILLVTEQMICAGYAEGGKDPCEGDLGGPLVIDQSQVGIVSKTFCGQANHPAIYSAIPNQRAWIRDTAGV